MADLIAAVTAGLLGGIISGSLSGVLVFEYETRRERRLIAQEAKENAAVVLEQISLLVEGGPRGAVTANRRRALQEVAEELARGVAGVVAGLRPDERRTYQSLLLRLGDDVALLQRRGDREVARRLEHSARAAGKILRGQHY